MALNDVLSSPRRSSPTHFSFQSSSFKKQFSPSDVSCSSLFQRHRFLLTVLVLLAFLCTIYLYFAVTLGSNGSCSGLLGSERELCQLKQAKDSLHSGKLKFF